MLVTTMMKPILLLLLSSFLPPILTVDPPLPSPDGSDFIRTSCNTTLYPDLCFSSLSTFANSINNDSNHLARVAISHTLSNTLHLVSYLQNTYGNCVDHGCDHPTASILKDCSDNLKDAVGEMRDSLAQMKELVSTGSVQSFRFQMSNVKTWLSAALTNQYTCTEGFEDLHVDGSIKDDVSSRVDDVKKLTSIALALVNHYADKAIP